MLLILLSWIIIYFITSVLGYGLIKLVWPERMDTVSQTEKVLVGLVGLVVICQTASLAYPADYRLVVALLLFSALINWRLTNQPAKVALQSLHYVAKQPFFWVLMGGVLVFSICVPATWDSGLYHIPTIRWYERFRVIPGLGNLHGRLAFNSSFFVASAAFGFTDVVGQTLFPLNGFSFLLIGTYVMGQMRHPETMPGLRAFKSMILGLIMYYLLYPLSSPSSDIWATVFTLFIFFFWLDGIDNTNQVQFFLLIALVFLCLTIKLATLPLLLLIPILLVIQWYSLKSRQILQLAAVGSLIIGPWLIRNVILSGYLIYPFPALDFFSVDWKIPLSTVHFEENCVAFWARFHLDESQLDPAKLAWSPVRWIPVWWHDQGNPQTLGYYKLNLPLFVAACLSPLFMVFQGTRQGFSARLWSAYAVALAGFLFWFIKAPEFRFGFAFLWMTALIPWIPLLGRVPTVLSGHLAIWPLAIFLAFMVVKLVNQKQPITLQSLVIPNWLSYRDLEAKGIRYKPYRTQSGLVVLIPRGAVSELRCYELEKPSPCTPYFFKDLEMRGGAFETGFRRQSNF